MGWVEKQYGTNLSSREVSYYRSQDLPSMREAFKPLVENRLGVPIRHVVTYRETTVHGGYCETCSFSYVAVQVVFKSSEGKLCVLPIEGTMFSLMAQLTATR